MVHEHIAIERPLTIPGNYIYRFTKRDLRKKSSQLQPVDRKKMPAIGQNNKKPSQGKIPLPIVDDPDPSTVLHANHLFCGIPERLNFCYV